MGIPKCDFNKYTRGFFRTLLPCTLLRLSFLWADNYFRKNLHFRCLAESEAATQRCSKEKVFWKYAANLQGNTRAEVQFQ